MKYTSVSNNETSENTYLLYDENTKNGIIIDPGCTIDKIERLISETGVTVKYIFLTHCHYDHISSAKELQNRTSALIVCGENAALNISDIKINLSVYGLGYEIKDLKADKILKDGEIFTLDSISLKCIYTPGHTNCSVCYLVENELFCGDTLFLRSCGRWDLPTGDFKTLENSIKEKLYSLPDDVNVHSGHGHNSTIGYEKKHNFYIKL